MHNYLIMRKQILILFFLIPIFVFGQTTPSLKQVLGSGNDGNAKQIKNIANPSSAQDAATKAYVDGLGGGGTVTTFTMTPNQGASGVVTNPTTTPSLQIILGAITPSVSVTSPLGVFQSVKLPGASSGTTTIAAPSAAGTYTFTLPPNAGTLDYILKTNGSGTTSFSSLQSLGAWMNNGNTGLSGTTNFIGNQDDVPFNIRINNVRAGRIENTGQNTFLGYSAGASITSGVENTGFGNVSLLSLSTGINNTAIGVGSARLITNGSNNTAIGYFAFGNQNVNNGVALGTSAGLHETGNGKFYIDNQDRLNENGGRTLSMLYGSFGSTVSTQSLTVNGQFRINNGSGSTGQYLRLKADGFLEYATLTSSGTMTSFTVTPANGVSAVVTNPTLNAAATFSLGAITPISVNGNILQTGTGTLNLNNFTLTAIDNNTVDRANDISGGVAGSLPFQLGTGTTSMLAPGTSGYALISGGVSTPTWVPTDKALKDFFADASNTSTSETDLYSFTTSANTLTTNGDKLVAKYSGIHAANGNTKTFKVYFGGTEILSYAMTTPGQQWEVNVMVIKTSASTARASATIYSNSVVDGTTQYTAITGLTLSSTNIIKLTGTGGASTDITAKFGAIEFKPAAL